MRLFAWHDPLALQSHQPHAGVLGIFWASNAEQIGNGSELIRASRLLGARFWTLGVSNEGQNQAKIRSAGKV